MRVALHTRLKPGREEEYEQVHAVIPRDLEIALRDAGVTAWASFVTASTCSTCWRSRTTRPCGTRCVTTRPTSRGRSACPRCWPSRTTTPVTTWASSWCGSCRHEARTRLCPAGQPVPGHER